ncbi:hypothetical protein [Gordonia sp. UCD-TK1]|uniref:hypothetical protein n=1 Tax=Gordonia sp. UCD-TK1 TaxID=1857893 RepID=UPI001586D735|nr:hypothetical protein [Gordonia sp. UCD-TK1]
MLHIDVEELALTALDSADVVVHPLRYRMLKRDRQLDRSGVVLRVLDVQLDHLEEEVL